MAESDNAQDPKTPPKLKIDKAGTAKENSHPEATGSKQDSATEDDLLYGETTRIHLDDVDPKGGTPSGPAEPGAPPGDSTTRIDLEKDDLKRSPAEEQRAKKDTSRVDVAAARQPPPGLPDPQQQEKKAKKDTSRVDAASATPAAHEPPHDTVPMPTAADKQPPHDTERLAGAGEAGPHDTERLETGAPGETARIDLAKTTPPRGSGVEDMSDEERERMMKASTIPIEGFEPMAAKKKTARVEVEDESAGKHDHETARIDTPATLEAETRIPSETAKVNLDRELSPDDVFAPIGPAKPKAAPDFDDEVAMPAAGAEGDGTEGGRSKTARIDLPPDVLSPKSGRPKTIRIKRADAEAAEKPPTKPPSKEPRKAPGKARGAPKTRTPKVKVESPPGEIGGAFGVISLCAVIVCLILLYVLAAQTVLPTLSWFGKIPS